VRPERERERTCPFLVTDTFGLGFTVYEQVEASPIAVGEQVFDDGQSRRGPLVVDVADGEVVGPEPIPAPHWCIWVDPACGPTW
jgi:hypothetical protein